MGTQKRFNCNKRFIESGIQEDFFENCYCLYTVELYKNQGTKIAVWVGDDTAYLDIARDHFGSQTLLTSHATSCSVLQAVAKGTASAGILPLPQIDEGTWWPLLGSENNGRQVRICARLPFVSRENRRGGCVEALLVADLVPVETGDDGSYLIIECSSPISRPRLTELLTSAGFALTALVSLPNTMDIASREIFLIEVAGFVDIDDRRLGQLLDDNPVFTVVRAVGSYAMPLNTET